MKYYLLLLLAAPFFFSCKDKDPKNDKPEQKQEEAPAEKPVFTSISACIFSEIAYCSNPQQQLDKYLPGWKITWNPSSIAGNYAFVATDGNNFAIAFRGSLISFTEDAFDNWIYHDLNVASQDSWPYCKAAKARVSQGSYIAWQNLEKMKDKTSGQSLRAYLLENIPADKPLVLTGHSLGGNLAITYASYLWSKFDEAGHTKNNMNVITFAAPAPGNGAFTDDFDAHFPSAIRVENTNDIVPKFPVSSKMEKLSDLYTPSPAASAITVGYKDMNTQLSTVFSLLSKALLLLEFRPDFSGYTHTSGDGQLITVPLSGKNTANSAADWFAEAGYQHSMVQYAVALGGPVIKCE